MASSAYRNKGLGWLAGGPRLPRAGRRVCHVSMSRAYVGRMAADQHERFPVQRTWKADHELLILQALRLRILGNDNLDIEVRTLDGRFSASVFTVRNVVSLLDKNRAIGEPPIAYFRCPDAVVVDEPLTEELIRKLVAAKKCGNLVTWPRLHDELDDD